MFLIVGINDYRMQKFLQKMKLYKPHIIANKMCNLKHIKENVDIIIPFSYLDMNDCFTNTYIHLPELLMSLNITSVTYYNNYNENRLINICSLYNVKCKKSFL